MNTASLVGLYGKLTPEERFPLLLAAMTRGDEPERARLLHSAPRIHYSAPHHYRVGAAFFDLSKLHFMKLLEFAAEYLEDFAVAATAKSKRGADPLKHWQTVMMSGYLFRTYWEGWRQFCAALQLAPEVLWEKLPGFATVKRAERLVRVDAATGRPGTAYVAEGAARYLARHALGGPEASIDEETCQKYWPVTAENIATTLHLAWKECLEK